MATKVEEPSSLEPQPTQAAGSTSTTSVAASTPKISMFGKKTGFVIPKNKLSGSLVPIVRGGNKSETNNAPKEESTKQALRKTKWGIDLIQDSAVRRSRALAYQTRVEQITKQLESENLGFEDDHGSQSPSQIPSNNSSENRVDKELNELLELERREAIGECIKLNPSYKAPPGYKPVLREAKIPVPLKAYPSVSFVGLILGPENSTKKQLEEETGSKIQIRGTKADTGEKVEVNQLDDSEAQGIYEELYVHISAETYEKIDAAVALVELLLTPVSGKSAVSTDSASISGDAAALDQNHVASTGYMMPIAAVNLGIQPVPPQGPYQPYTGPWQPPNLYMLPAPSFAFMPSTIPVANAPPRFPPSTITTLNAPSLIRTGPPAPTMFNPNTLPIRSRPPVPVLQGPYAHEIRPRNPMGPSGHPVPVQQPQSFANAISQPNALLPTAFPSVQSLPSAPMGMLVTAAQAPVQTAVMPLSGAVTRGLLPNRPPPGNPHVWSGASTMLPAGMTNMTPVPPRMMPESVRPIPVNSMPVGPVQCPAETQTFSSPSPVGNFAVQSHMQMAMPLTVSQIPPSSALSLPSVPLVPRPTQSPLPGPASAPATRTPSTAILGPLPAQVTVSPSAPLVSQQPALTPNLVSSAVSVSQVSPSLVRPPIIALSSSAATLIRPGLAQAPAPGSIPPVSTGQGLPQMPAASPPSAAAPLVSVSGSLPNLPSSNIFSTLVRPQRPSSSDFTFQPQKPQVSTSQGETRPNIQPISQNPLSRPPVPPIQPPPVPQAPSFRPAVNNLPQQTGMHALPRPNIPAPKQTIIPRAPQTSGFGGNSNIAPPPTFLNPLGPPRLLNPASQRAPPNIGESQSLNMPVPLRGSVPVHTVNLQQIQNNTQVLMTQPAGFAVTNQQTSKNHGYMSVTRQASVRSSVNQIYDPFSPTSISSTQSQQGSNVAKAGGERRQLETDAEYEDLMASVGVK